MARQIITRPLAGRITGLFASSSSGNDLPLSLVGRRRSPLVHLALACEGKIMNISKDQIVQFLQSQGNHDQAKQAGQQLPDQIDTDNGDHAQLLSKLGMDPGMITDKFGDLGKLL
jgi:hypothetical protein